MNCRRLGGKRAPALPKREIVFVSFVRASEAKLCVPARRCCFRGWVLEGLNVLRAGRALPVPFLGSAARCFVVLSSAYQCSVMLFNAS